MAIHVIRSGIFGVNSLIVGIENPDENDRPGGKTDSGVGKSSKKCFVVDPAACSLSHDENSITDYLKSKKLDCLAIVLTHSHFDHITGIVPVKKAFPQAKICIHQSESQELQNPPGPMNTSLINFFDIPQIFDTLVTQPPADQLLHEGSDIFGWKVLHTPGHSPGSICLFNKAENTLISGDTLFDYGGYGRTDMYGGDEATIIHSLARLKKEIPVGTLVYPGHESFGFKFD